MSDPSESKKISIPQWQRQTDSEPQGDPDSAHQEAPTSTAPASRATLLKQASKFLDEHHIKNAPTDTKIAFLESKGLTQGELSKLLDIPSKNTDANELKEAGPEETSNASISQSKKASPSPAYLASAEKDIPPIITYPEFLIHSRKPPPLITASRLVNTFYVFSGTAAAIYGTSKYILDPMLESLTSARHSLFDTAQTNLDTLNERLTKNISAVPDAAAKQSKWDDESSSKTTEDMDALFNRTIGTQTSPPSSPSSFTSESEPKPPSNAISTQENSLKSLHSSLSTLLAPSQSSNTDPNLSSQIRDLKQYLDSLSYPVFNTYSLAESKDDAVNRFKAEVRGVKGVLLSARNFPSGSSRAMG